MRLNVILHQIRVCSGDQNLSLIKIVVLISDYHRSIKSLQNIFILSLCLGKNIAVINTHVRFCNIAYGDQTFEDSALADCWQGDNILILHQIPCLLQRDVSVYALRSTDLNILDLRLDIFHKARRLNTKVVQHKLCLRIYMSGAAWLILHPRQFLFHLCITNRRTDRIRVRVLMSNYDRLSLFFVQHNFLLILHISQFF